MRASKDGYQASLLAAALLLLPIHSEAFSPMLQSPLASTGVHPLITSALTPGDLVDRVGRVSSPTILAAAGSPGKRRRRRKDAPVAPPQTDGELPDFDFDEEEIVTEAPKEIKAEAPPQPKQTKASSVTASASTYSTPIKKGSGLNPQLAEDLGGNVEGLDEDFILSTMRGKGSGDNWQPPRSIQDTINDRSLERLMDFDLMIEKDGGGIEEKVDLPTMEEVISRRKQREAQDALKEGRVEEAAMLVDTAGMGKKAARAAERKAAAIQREVEAESEKSPLEGLNVLKLLENGAWVGIGMLVLWEVYINSPFFERAAPLIPVVYENDLPPGM